MKRHIGRSAIIIGFMLALMPIAASAEVLGETTSPSEMSDFALWAIIGGAALTYVAALVNRVHWPDYIRFATFFVFSMVYAAIDAYFTRSLDFDNWTRSLLIVVGAGITFYNLNKGSVKAFEVATT